MKKPSRGRMREWIVIQRAEVAGGDWEDVAAEWVTVEERWAAYEPAKTLAVATNQTVENLGRAVFTIEDGAAVREADRIVWEDRTFTIEAVRELDHVGQWYGLESVELKPENQGR